MITTNGTIYYEVVCKYKEDSTKVFTNNDPLKARQLAFSYLNDMVELFCHLDVIHIQGLNIPIHTAEFSPNETINYTGIKLNNALVNKVGFQVLVHFIVPDQEQHYSHIIFQLQDTSAIDKQVMRIGLKDELKIYEHCKISIPSDSLTNTTSESGAFIKQSQMWLMSYLKYRKLKMDSNAERYSRILEQQDNLTTARLVIKSYKALKRELTSLLNTQGGFLFWGVGKQNTTRSLFTDDEVKSYIEGHNMLMQLMFPSLNPVIKISSFKLISTFVLVYEVAPIASGKKEIIDGDQLYIRSDKGLLYTQINRNSLEKRISAII